MDDETAALVRARSSDNDNQFVHPVGVRAQPCENGAKLIMTTCRQFPLGDR